MLQNNNTKKLNIYFIICLILFSMFPILIANAENYSILDYNEQINWKSGNGSMHGTIFSDDNASLLTGWVENGNIFIESNNGTHLENQVIRINKKALNKLKGYRNESKSLGITHIDNDGNKKHYVQNISMNNGQTPFVYLTVNFSTIIINGMTGTTTTTLTGLSENQSILVPNGTSYDLNITNQIVASLFGSEYVYNAGTSDRISIAALDSTHFVVAYRDVSNSDYGTAIIGTISGSTISYGSEYVFQATATFHISVSALDSTHFVVTFSPSPNDAAIIGTVSGNTISYGSEYEFNTIGSQALSVSTLDSTHFVIVYHNGSTNQGMAVIGTVSGSTISYGSKYTFESNIAIEPICSALDSTHFVVAYKDIFNSEFGTAIIGTISGSTISYGSEYVFNAASSPYTSISALDNTHFVVSYQDIGDSHHGNAIIGIVSGSIISYGSEYTFNAAGTSYTSISALDSTHFVVSYEDVSNSHYGTATIGTISGNTISYGSEYVFNAVTTTFISVSALDSTHFAVAYKDNGNSNYGTATIGDTASPPPSSNIKATVTGDFNEQSYSASQSREFTLTPTGYVENLIINTTSTDYDVTVTTYWTEDTIFIEETVANGYVKQYINYTPSFDITSADLNTTIINDLTTHDYLGTTTSTLNGTPKTTMRVLQEVNASVDSLIKDVEYLWNVTIQYNNIFTLSEQSNKDVYLGESESFTDSIYNDPEGLPIDSRLWKFGDGDTSSDSNPTHIYTAIGLLNANYTVTETATISPQTIMKEFNVTVSVQPPQNITTLPHQTSVDIDWDNYASADNFSVYEMEDGFSYVNTNPTVDGIKDVIYDYAHEFLIFSPNPVNTADYETIYPLRTSLGVYFLIESVDNDYKTGDDDCIYYFDLDNNGLTVNDYAWKITDNFVKRYYWDGASWKIAGGSNAVGVSTGAGTHYPIHELFIPVAELGGNWTNGSTVKVLVKREDSSLTPDVITWYPYGNINDSDTLLWQEMVLNDPNTYNLLANVTLSNYTAINLTPFTIYHGAVSTWNGTDESDYTLFDVITEDLPTYNASGFILDIHGDGISNATVFSCNGFVHEITTTNESGYWIGYKFYNDTYTICGNATGYESNSTLITIAGVNLTNVNITLEYSQYFPSTPTNLTYSTYNFGINYSFIKGVGLNNTDSYNITFNGTQYNGVTDLFFNKLVGAHGYGNITIYAYNNTNDGALSTGFLTNNITIPNNNITITDISSSTINEGETVNVDCNYTDLDLDTPIFSTNRTDLFTDFNITTGIGSWTTNLSSLGIYSVDFGVSDGYNSTSNYTMIITVILEEPSIISGLSTVGTSKKATGGVGSTGEIYENIIKKEVSMIYFVITNKLAYIDLKEFEIHNIKSISFMPTKNWQDVGITIEKLNTKSIFAETPAPYEVYSNVNIWVGKSGYSENNLKDAQIEFTVEKDWLVSNAITQVTLMQYNIEQKMWEKLPTKIIKISSDKYTYIATTQSFSPFAIVGESISTTHFIPLLEKIINILPENVQEPINEIIDDNEKICSSIIISFILIIIVSLLFTVITAIDSTLIHILLTVALMGLIYLITQDFYPLEYYITENISDDFLNKIKYTKGVLSTLIYLLITIIPAQYIKKNR